jgi:PTS system nitrogen regulatory IIA component
MNLQDILTLDCTHCVVPVTSKKRILEKIATIAATKISEFSQSELLQSLKDREKVGSTGIGNGIAIPHGRLKETKQVVAILLTTVQPIDFDAIDNRSVDIFVALFVPQDSCQDHLCTLQSIARLFSDKVISKQVRKCKSDQQLYNLVLQSNQ